MGATAGFMLLADLGSSLEQFIRVFVTVYVLMILAYVILSWVPVGGGALGPVRGFLHDVCEPYLRLFRRFIPSLGPVDVSPIVAVLVLQFGGYALAGLVGRSL